MVPPCHLRLITQYHSQIDTCSCHDKAPTSEWVAYLSGLPVWPTFISDSEVVADVVEGGDIRLLGMSGVLECYNVFPLKGSVC